MDKNSSDQEKRRQAVDAVLEKMRDKVLAASSAESREADQDRDDQVIDKVGYVVGSGVFEPDATAF